MYRVLFHIGSFPVHTYGVTLIIAFMIALVVARKRAVRYGVNPNKLSDMSFVLLIAGVLGARIMYLIQEPPVDPKEYFSLQFAGLTSFGGLIGGGIALLWWCLKTKTSIRTVLDIMGPPLLIGHAIGRVGCLLNGCCFGGVCANDFPLGVHMDHTTRLFHPAQIYDSLMNLAGLAILLLIEKRGVLKLGQVFSLAIVFHGLSRFIYEFWRAGTEEQVKAGIASSTYWGNLPITQAQAAAAVIVLFGAVLFVVYARKPRPEDPPPANPTIIPEPMSS
jgi:phosphatidylglycerol---prolipoprotein diacylglyceryl transferase